MGRYSGHITFDGGIACGAEQVLSFEDFSSVEQKNKLDTFVSEIKEAQ